MIIPRIIQRLFMLLGIATIIAVTLGCGNGRHERANPVTPSSDYSIRSATWFPLNYETIFGGILQPPAADVDLASVVNGTSSGGSPGSMATFPDDSQWVVAVACAAHKLSVRFQPRVLVCD